MRCLGSKGSKVSLARLDAVFVVAPVAESWMSRVMVSMAWSLRVRTSG